MLRFAATIATVAGILLYGLGIICQFAQISRYKKQRSGSWADVHTFDQGRRRLEEVCGQLPPRPGPIVGLVTASGLIVFFIGVILLIVSLFL